MALERTFLAWVRTGLALMGFGFVVAKFGLFLRELYSSGVRTGHLTASSGFSAQVGIGLVLLGVAVNIVSVYRYHRVLHRLESGLEHRPPRWLAIVLASVLALIGLSMAIYLIVVPR